MDFIFIFFILTYCSNLSFLFIPLMQFSSITSLFCAVICYLPFIFSSQAVLNGDEVKILIFFSTPFYEFYTGSSWKICFDIFSCGKSQSWSVPPLKHFPNGFSLFFSSIAMLLNYWWDFRQPVRNTFELTIYFTSFPDCHFRKMDFLYHFPYAISIPFMIIFKNRE